MSATKPQYFQIRASPPLSNYINSVFITSSSPYMKSWDARDATHMNNSFLLLHYFELNLFELWHLSLIYLWPLNYSSHVHTHPYWPLQKAFVVLLTTLHPYSKHYVPPVCLPTLLLKLRFCFISTIALPVFSKPPSTKALLRFDSLLQPSPELVNTL